MIKHIWTILCHNSTTDKDDNSLSISQVLEGLEVKVNDEKIDKTKIKANIPIQYEILSYFVRTKEYSKEEKAHLRISILDPELNKIADLVKIIKFKKNIKRMRSRIKTNGFPVNIPGFYIFLIDLKTKEDKDYKNVAQVPIEVKIK